MPVAKVVRLPPVTQLKPIEAVSAIIGAHLVVLDAELLGRHHGRCEARVPPMSGLPEITVTVPSSPM